MQCNIAYYIYICLCLSEAYLPYYDGQKHINFSICLKIQGIDRSYPFLAPPAERQQSFSNTESSVVDVNFSLKMLISQKGPFLCRKGQVWIFSL